MILTIAILAIVTTTALIMWRFEREESSKARSEIETLTKDNKKLTRQIKDLQAHYPDKCSKCNRYVKKGSTVKYGGRYLCQQCYKKDRGSDATAKRD